MMPAPVQAAVVGNYPRPAAVATAPVRPVSQPAEPELSADDQQQAQLLMQVNVFGSLIHTFHFYYFLFAFLVYLFFRSCS